MCAIAGLVGLTYDEQDLERIHETMIRRGPDGRGIHRFAGGALLHTRLAVIDPQGGAQPMTGVQGGQIYTVTYNGELYNTPELRRELEDLGHRFETRSDTEVVLRAYMQWGPASVERFNGIFALGIWEEHSRQLFLARDRMGVKPLFYSLHRGGLLFASEIKTILACPGFSPQLDAQGVGEVVLLGPGRTPGSGVFRGIRELEPGFRAVFRDGVFSPEPYWRLRDREHRQDLQETGEAVGALVTDAIRRQMISDVPIGMFLSGGLDSSLISAVCAEAFRNRGEPCRTFSVGYRDNGTYFIPGKFQPEADDPYIRQMQQFLGSRHSWTVLGPEELFESLSLGVKARDLPGMGDVDVSLLLFCREIRSQVKVALSGECADEIFGGYPWFRDPQIRRHAGFPWAQNTGLRGSLLHPAYKSQLEPESFVADRYRDTLSQVDILPGTDPRERRTKEMAVLNQRWFMQTLLDRKDRMSMYWGLEVRVPFCDHRIAEYLYGVPWEFKEYGGQEKGLLRKAMEPWLPRQVLYRKKSPYPKTWHPEYTRLVQNAAQELLLDQNAPVFSLLAPEMVRKMVENTPQWPWYGQLMTGPQTLAYILQVDLWLREYRISLI